MLVCTHGQEWRRDSSAWRRWASVGLVQVEGAETPTPNCAPKASWPSPTSKSLERARSSARVARPGNRHVFASCTQFRPFGNRCTKVCRPAACLGMAMRRWTFMGAARLLCLAWLNTYGATTSVFGMRCVRPRYR